MSRDKTTFDDLTMPDGDNKYSGDPHLDWFYGFGYGDDPSGYGNGSGNGSAEFFYVNKDMLIKEP